MNSRPSILFVSLALAACSQHVPVIDLPDAGATDAETVDLGPPPVPAHCEVTAGATWTDLGSPADAERLLPASTDIVAMHGGVVAAAGRSGVFVTDGTTWRTLTSTGLGTEQVDAIVSHGGTWYVAVDGPMAVVLRYDGDATGWTDVGPLASRSPIYALLDFGTSLVAFGADGLFELPDATPSAWREVDSFGDDFISDAVVSGTQLYVVTVSATTGESSIQRSTDLVAWETVPYETGVTVQPADLEAGGGVLIATPGLASEDGYYLLDATTDTFVAVATPDAIVPRWLADDGAVMGETRGDFYFAPALGGTWRRAPMLWPSFASSGLASIWHIASEGAAIVFGTNPSVVVPFGVEPVSGTRVVRSDDHGRTFHVAASALEPAELLDVATDGTAFIAHVRGDLRDAAFIMGRVMTLESDDTWTDRSSGLTSLAFAAVAGVEGAFVTRPSEYTQIVPQWSRDGGHTWTLLGEKYPTYETNISWAVRRASSYTAAPDGRLYVATLGGVTSLPGSGSKTPWGYRPGSGVWRSIGGEWQPVNAGIPIEALPAAGGPPFRSDIRSIAWTEQGLFAALDGRGVFGLVDDRWEPNGVGIPVDVTPEVGAIGASVYALGGGTLYVLDRGVWSPVHAGAGVTSAAARADLWVRVATDGLAMSDDVGESWRTLPATFTPRVVVMSRDRLYATDTAQHVHALALTCTEAM